MTHSCTITYKNRANTGSVPCQNRANLGLKVHYCYRIMDEISVYLFGAPRIEHNGVEVAPGHRKAMALLAYLLLDRRAYARDALANLLWPDYDGSSALGELRRMLYALNKALGKGWIEADRQTVAMVDDKPIQVDVEEFRLLLADCLDHGHDASAVCERCIQSLTQAVAVQAAPFMEGFTLPDTPDFDLWQHKHTVALRREGETALEKLAAYYLHQNELELSLQHARHLLALDPLRESSYCLLMLLEARANRRTAALHYYERLMDVLRQELDVAPDFQTQQLAEAIKHGGDVMLPDLPEVIEKNPTASQGNLPAQTVPFIGREEELAALTEHLISDQWRLITIVGPGGVGKTHLSLIAGEQVRDHYADGVYFVPLAPLNDADDIIPAIAEGVGYQFQQDNRDRRTQMVDYLRNKHLLLILDNYEHLLTGAPLITDILSAASKLDVLVTSRERLNRSAEMVFYLDGLGTPESDKGAADYDAVRLFLQSAQQVQPDFSLNNGNSAGVVQICRLVQGMPLGIMLAASWLSMLTVDEVLSEIRRGIDFLEAELVDLPERQRSIRAVFDHSWNLLTPAERDVFMRLAVFRGGFTREAVTAITSADLRMLIRLSNKSLIRRDKTSGRYQIHELLRQYAEERLAASDEQTDSREKHARFYLEYLVGFLPNLKGHGQSDALKTIEADYDNIKAGWQWAVRHHDSERIASAIEPLALYYQLGSRVQEGQRVFEIARQKLQQWADLPYWLLSVRFRKPEDSAQVVREHLQTALAQAKSRGDDHETAYCRVKLGELAHHHDHDTVAAIAQYEIGISLYRHLDDRYYLAESLSKLGEAYRLLGDVDRNQRLVQESYRIQQAIGDEFGLSQTMRALGMMTYLAGEYTKSLKYCKDALDIQRRMNYVAGQINNGFYVGLSSYLCGEIIEGRRMVEESLHMAEDIGLQSAIGWALASLSTFDSFAGDYDLAEHHLDRADAIQTNPFQQIGAGDTWLQLTRTWARVVLLLGHEQYDEAKAHLHSIWQQACETYSISYLTQFTPIVAILHGHAGLYKEAAELLGMTFAQSDVGTRWMHHWVQLNALRDTLHEQLDEAAYSAAWEQGQQSDLIATAQMILKTFWTE